MSIDKTVNVLKTGNPYTIFKQQCKDGFVVEINNDTESIEHAKLEMINPFRVSAIYGGMISEACFKSLDEARDMADYYLKQHN